MTYEFDLAIIGAGSGGLMAAEVAPKIGLKAALIERSRIGGDCLWTGCVPSKSLVVSARVAQTIRDAEKFGLPATELEIDTAPVWSRIRDVQNQIAETDDSPDRFRDMGIEVIFGEASLLDGHSVRVGERTVTARYVLLTTGSRPAIPPIEGLEQLGFLTNETLYDLERAPRSLVVLGAGPIGVEVAQSMNRLGVQTTLLEMAGRILERDERSLTEALLQVLRREGVDVHLNVRVSSATRGEGGKALRGTKDGEEQVWAAEEVLVAAGRRPNIESLGLEKAGVKSGRTGITVDSKLRTSVDSVYAAGDCAGRFLFTHSAAAEVAAIIRNMFYPGSQDAPDQVPWATYSDPELAHVGMTSDEARRKLGEDEVRVFEQGFSNNDRARINDATEGKVIVVTDTKLNILGAHVLAPHASEMIGQFTLAMQLKAPLTPTFRDLIQIYPTFSSSFAPITEEAVYEQLGKPLYRAARKLNERFGL